MQQQKPFLAGILFLLAGLSACDSTEIGDSKDVNQDKIYMDYHIACEEATDHVVLNFKYRFAGSAGTTLVLNDPSQVELDGKKLAVDSTEFAGAYYEVEKKISQYTGKHLVSFTDFAGKKWDNGFDIAPIQLDPLPATADKKKDLVIAYSTVSMGANDYAEISSSGTDSSFRYEQQGPAKSITIPVKELKRQKGKSFFVTCTFYKEIALSQTASEGGRLKMTYKLRPVKIKLQ